MHFEDDDNLLLLQERDANRLAKQASLKKEEDRGSPLHLPPLPRSLARCRTSSLEGVPVITAIRTSPASRAPQRRLGQGGRKRGRDEGPTRAQAATEQRQTSSLYESLPGSSPQYLEEGAHKAGLAEARLDDTPASARGEAEEDIADTGQSPFMVGATLLMSMVGAGMLSIPFVFHTIGVVPATVLLLVSASCMTYTGELLIDLHRTTGLRTLEEFAMAVSLRSSRRYHDECGAHEAVKPRDIRQVVAGRLTAAEVVDEDIRSRGEQGLGDMHGRRNEHEVTASSALVSTNSSIRMNAKADTNAHSQESNGVKGESAEGAREQQEQEQEQEQRQQQSQQLYYSAHIKSMQRRSSWLVLFVPVVTALGVCGAALGYVKIINDIIAQFIGFVTHHVQPSGGHPAPGVSVWLDARLWVLVVFSCVVLPLTLVRDLRRLRFSSLLGLFFSLNILATVLVQYFSQVHGQTPSPNAAFAAVPPAGAIAALPPVDTLASVPLANGFATLPPGSSLTYPSAHLSFAGEVGLFSRSLSSLSLWHHLLAYAFAVSVFNFSFVYHLNVLPLYASLSSPHRRPSTMKKVVRASMAASTGIYWAFGASAAAVYGSQTQGNILQSLDDSAPMLALKAVAALVVLCSFPLVFHPLRALVFSLLASDRNGQRYEETSEEEDEEGGKEKQGSRSTRATYTTSRTPLRDAFDHGGGSSSTSKGGAAGAGECGPRNNSHDVRQSQVSQQRVYNTFPSDREEDSSRDPSRNECKAEKHCREGGGLGRRGRERKESVRCREEEEEEEEEEQQEREGTPAKYGVKESALLLAIIVGLALILPGLLSIFGVTGSTFVVLICYVFPSVFHIRLASKHLTQFTLTCLVLIFALSTAALALLQTFRQYLW